MGLISQEEATVLLIEILKPVPGSKRITLISSPNRCNSNNGEEQAGVGQAPGGAGEGDHGEGPDGLSVLHPPGTSVSP